jgi:hypothetical protein
MKRLLTILLITIITTGFLVGCVARTPNAKSAHRMVEKHFKRYGNKYKMTDFGQLAIEKVEIIEIKEIQKGVAEIFAFVILQEGLKVYKVRMTASRRAGWRFESWENLGSS